jgi:HEAT repeat protein
MFGGADFVGPNDRSAVLVRTFIAMALAKHQTDRSFQALLEMMKFDDTPSVRAGSVESRLSLFGGFLLSHLVTAFIQDDHWLLRRSILAAITEMESPIELLEICLEGLQETIGRCRRLVLMRWEVCTRVRRR